MKIIEISKLYHEKGIPLFLILEWCKEQNITINWYKTVEELYYQGFSVNAISALLKEENIVLPKIDDFVYLIANKEKANKLWYEITREIIFDSLFKSRDEAKEFFDSLI